jgi:RNA polymerase II subunit A small phosphatase-like protein
MTGDAARSKLSVVLDLDETLVHATLARPAACDLELRICYGDRPVMIYVQKRPGVDTFFRSVCCEFDVFVFTASLLEYAAPVVQAILPCFPRERILTRAQCSLVNGVIVKDLRIFRRDLARVLLVDNTPQSFALQPANGVLVSTWVGDDSDTVLLGELLPFLRFCATVPDVRTAVSQFLH